MNQTAKCLYEFGPFLLDPEQHLLFRDGVHVPLSPKAFDTLRVLVENGGRVTEKDELLKRVWPDTFVEEVNLAKNVSFLRKALGGEQSDQYIETIPKRGYRFVPSVKEISEEDAASMMVAAVNQEPQRMTGLPHDGTHPGSRLQTSPGVPPGLAESRFRSLKWPAVFVVLGLIVVVAAWLILGSALKTRSVAPHLTIVPFTSFPGRETHAAFSPNGEQIAFVWDGEKGDNQDIYVKLIGAEKPLRLTNDPAADTRPAWSPNGRFIAFFRESPDRSGYYLIPALGGPERKVTDVFYHQNRTLGSSQYYSPDGKFLAVSDKNSQGEPFSLFLVSIETGQKRKITSPPAGTEGDSLPGFSPDGKTIAFIRSSSQTTDDLYLAPLAGGEPRRLTFDNTSITGLAWTSDGRDMVFASRRESSIHSLWRISTAGGTPERLPTIGRNIVSPAISRQGDRLAYTQTLDDENIWRLEIDSTGHGLTATSLIASTLTDDAPDYSPDGQKIVFASNRSGGYGIWVCDRDGTNPRELINRGPSLTGTPRWSPDGHWIAFDSRSNDSGQEGNADIYVISAEGGQPRRITSGTFENIVPSWSRDGKWIYFGSMRSGAMQIWKVAAESGQPIQVTQHGGFEGFESTDGKMFYYSKGRAVPGIWQVPPGGGEETLLLDNHKAGYWRFWALTEKGIYFATANVLSHPVIEFFSFATHNVTSIAALDKPISRSDSGLAISPDRRWLLFSQMDQSGSDIMLGENFR